MPSNTTKYYYIFSVTDDRHQAINAILEEGKLPYLYIHHMVSKQKAAVFNGTVSNLFLNISQTQLDVLH
jgi:hypothetical protein